MLCLICITFKKIFMCFLRDVLIQNNKTDSKHPGIALYCIMSYVIW